MEDKAILDSIAELLEIDAGSLAAGTELSSLEQWDSLAFVSFIAMADAKYGRKVAPEELRRCKTGGDLVNLLK